MLKIKPIYVFVMFVSALQLRGILLLKPTDAEHHLPFVLLTMFSVIAAWFWGISTIKYDNHET